MQLGFITHFLRLLPALNLLGFAVHSRIFLPFTHCGGWPLCLKSIVLVLVRRKNGKNSWQCSGWVCESVFKRETPLFLSNVEQIHCPLLPNHWQIAKNQLFFHAFERVFYYPYKVYIYTVHTHNRISWSKSLDMLYNRFQGECREESQTRYSELGSRLFG